MQWISLSLCFRAKKSSTKIVSSKKKHFVPKYSFYSPKFALSAIQDYLAQNPKFWAETWHGSRTRRNLIYIINTPWPQLSLDIHRVEIIVWGFLRTNEFHDEFSHNKGSHHWLFYATSFQNLIYELCKLPRIHLHVWWEIFIFLQFCAFIYGSLTWVYT